MEGFIPSDMYKGCGWEVLTRKDDKVKTTATFGQRIPSDKGYSFISLSPSYVMSANEGKATANNVQRTHMQNIRTFNEEVIFYKMELLVS